MNGRPLTDAQISRALRAHLPEGAAAGLRERVMDAAETTAQLRSFPSFLGALSEADPVARRRSLLIAAALLVALAFASVAAVGALRLLQRDPLQDLSLEPPADVQAFVLSSYDRMPELPPVAMTWLLDGSTKGRIYVDRSGAVRFERYASADATEPDTYSILSGNRRGSLEAVGSDKVWVVQDEAVGGEDLRVFILAEIYSVPMAFGGPGCEMTRNPDEAGNGTAATGWRYVGVEYVAGRPAHHVACGGELSLDIDLWLDIETRVFLRARAPALDDARQPIPGEFRTIEMTEIAFGEQPAALFDFAPPEGITRMSSEAYNAYLCTRDLPNEEVVPLGPREDCSTPTEAEATPLPTVRPSVGRRTRGPAGPLAWTQASLKEDWPAPVRPEPAGGSSVLPMPLTHIDPTGDTGSDIDPWVDIRTVMGDTSIVQLKLVSNQPPVVDPAEQWIAYGVVIDDDRDGVPDWRYGIDNMPVDPAHELSTRVWRTNLHTGRTDGQGFLSEGYRGVWPNDDPNEGDANFEFGGTTDVAGRGAVSWGIALDMPFYTWASVIVNGRVVASDYAPDAGWLIATPGATPGGTYLLEDPFPIHLSMSVTEGWTVDRYGGEDSDAGGVSRDEGKTGVLFVIVDNPFNKDDCDVSENTTDPPLGPSVDDLVTFLVGLPFIDMSKNTDVTLDGYRGTYVEYTKTAGYECLRGGMGAWPTNSRRAVDEYNQVWILDVDGVRLVIDAFSTSASGTVRSELRQSVESIQIEP